MPKLERFPGWAFVKGIWGSLLDRPCVQEIIRAQQTPAMLRVRLLTTLLSDEFTDKEGELYLSHKELSDVKAERDRLLEEIAGLKKRYAKCHITS